MKHEMAALVELRARAGVQQFDKNRVLELSDKLLEMMRYNVEAAEVWASVDAGKKVELCSSIINLSSDTHPRSAVVESH